MSSSANEFGNSGEQAGAIRSELTQSEAETRLWVASCNTTKEISQRAVALGPTYGEDVATGPPENIDTARIRRERPVLPGVGGEFVQCEPDGLRGGSL